MAKRKISRNMLRITFGGDGLSGFPVGCESANVKLLLAHPEQDRDSYFDSVAGIGEKPLKRTYTVVEYREQANELVIDIALHANPGPATQWAVTASPGDSVALAGPGAVRLINADADWYLLAGDMAAMPAIITNIHTLPVNAKGYIVLEVLDELDRRELSLPNAMQLQWIVNAEPGLPEAAAQRPLVETVKSLEWLDGTPSVWVAGESDSVRALRLYLTKERLLSRESRYTSGYWKRGDSEDAFQLVKRSEPDD